MKILIVTQYFWPENFRINDLALGLQERGHQVSVLTGKPNYPEGSFFQGYHFWGRSRETWEGIPVFRAPLVPRGKRKFQLALNYLSFAFFGSLLALKVGKKDYDAIFVYEISPITVGLAAITAKWVSKAPLYFWVLDLWPQSLSAAGGFQNPTLLGMVDKLTRWIYRHCDKILVSSASFSQAIQTQGVAEEKIVYFPQWAEEEFSLHQEALSAEEAAQLPQGFVILYAGNLGEAQGFETLLDAAEKLKGQPRIQWVILGDGRKGDYVRSEVLRRGLEGCFHLLGRKPIQKMPAYFAAADCLLVSLKKDPLFALTLPAKVQAYMAFGAPILGVLEGEGADVILAAQAGWIAPPGEPDRLAQAVLDLAAQSPEALALMGKKAQDYARTHFDREKLLGQLETLFAFGHPNP